MFTEIYPHRFLVQSIGDSEPEPNVLQVESKVVPFEATESAEVGWFCVRVHISQVGKLIHLYTNKTVSVPPASKSME